MQFGDVSVSHHGHVAVVEMQRPPNNFFDVHLINHLADAFDALDEDNNVRALVLASQGKHFCAGNNYSDQDGEEERQKRTIASGNPLYTAAVRLFKNTKPVIGAIQGAAVGGGFGLAVMPDFRVASPEARFSANFVKLGFHPGFGITHTLPKVIGLQKANLMFLTGRRIAGEQAHAWGLVDKLVSAETLREQAIEFAAEIAENAPLALKSVRATMRQGIADAVLRQTDHEYGEQFRLQQTNDFKEGLLAVAERRPGKFTGS